MTIPSHILVIDDNSEMLETIAYMVKSMGGKTVHTAENTQQARKFLQDDPHIQMIICDWNMPNHTGIDFLAELGKEGNLISFIMVTARKDTDSVLQASNQGVDLYICKPFSSKELEQKINWVHKGGRRSEHYVQFTD